MCQIKKILDKHHGRWWWPAVQLLITVKNSSLYNLTKYIRVLYIYFRLERLAEEDYKLGDTGITIPKDMVVTIPIYAIHRDPEFFPDPEKFDPDRYSLSNYYFNFFDWDVLIKIFSNTRSSSDVI